MTMKAFLPPLIAVMMSDRLKRTAPTMILRMEIATSSAKIKLHATNALRLA
jgi:hypothetical protein